MADKDNDKDGDRGQQEEKPNPRPNDLRDIIREDTNRGIRPGSGSRWRGGGR